MSAQYSVKRLTGNVPLSAVKSEQNNSQLVFSNEPASTSLAVHPNPQVFDSVSCIPLTVLRQRFSSEKSLLALFNHWRITRYTIRANKHAIAYAQMQEQRQTALLKVSTGLGKRHNISSLDKGLKDRCVLVEMNAAKDVQYLPIARKVAADMNAVLSDAELLTEIAAANGSMCEVMSRVKRLARRRQSASTP